MAWWNAGNALLVAIFIVNSAYVELLKQGSLFATKAG